MYHRMSGKILRQAPNNNIKRVKLFIIYIVILLYIVLLKK